MFWNQSIVEDKDFNVIGNKNLILEATTYVAKAIKVIYKKNN